MPTHNTNVDWNVELTGSSTQEVKILRATILDQVYIPGIQGYGVIVIQNLSRSVDVEVVLGGSFPTVTGSYITPDPDTYTNIHRIAPGQVLKARGSFATVSYRACAGNPKIKFICGYDADISPVPVEPKLKYAQILRYHVVATDRNSKKVFAFYTSSGYLYRSQDGGKTWDRPFNFTGAVIASGFVTKNGTILIATNLNEVWRSTDNGATFTKVLTNTIKWRLGDGIFQNTETGTIIFGENPASPAPGGNIRIMRSTDDGVTWTAAITRTDANIRHWHSAQVDPYNGDWIVTSGDPDEKIEWWRSSDDGVTWTCIVGSTSGVTADQRYRTLGLFFTESNYLWMSDNPLWSVQQNFLYSAPKATPGTVSTKFHLPGLGMVHIQHGNKWIIGTQPEGETTIDRVARLYLSEDQGVTWEEIMAWDLVNNGDRGGFYGGFPYPDMEGYYYIQLYNVDGSNVPPWSYVTLKIKF